MSPATTTTAAHRPNRVLVALAAAWMFLSLAIGGAVTADSRADGPPSTAETTRIVVQR